ncbi:DUF4132 domain-containing protein [Streptomyces erythrochromogenes]|uniref:DUF4132 domain-containing protein n=1 Tax=Streptomyces erythrochromogenes TaxID=285574 RepID=UPI00381D1EA0
MHNATTTDGEAANRTATFLHLGSTFHTYYEGWSARVQAELAAGRSIPPAAVATLRRSVLVSYAVSDLSAALGQLDGPALNLGEHWADEAIADGRWEPLLAHAVTATAARPTAKWEKAARALLVETAADPDELRRSVLHWFGLVGSPRTLELTDPLYEKQLDPHNANALRGLAWFLPLLPAHPDTPRALGVLVETCLRKVPGHGPLNPKVANAGVTSLARSEGEAALAELARLASRVTFKGTLKIIETALDTRAQALGTSREEVEELAVPAFGLTGSAAAVGHGAFAFGESTALVEIRGSKAVLTWRTSAGKTVKSPPAVVRRDHADALKELKATVKDIDKTLSAQVERLDRQFLARRTWSYGPWRERFADHPLVGTLARRLIWTVAGIPVLFDGGDMRDLAGDPVRVRPDAEVGLWHPVGRDREEIAAWRERLEACGVTQPFKQAHREVYPLTDAERTTATYSNRFAGHILRQHQFHALAAVRGWRNKLRLSVDDSLPPAVRELPQWGLRAEYWIEADDTGDHYGDTTGSGSYLRLRTDQVRFYPIDAPPNHAHCTGGAYTMLRRGGQGHVDPLPLAGIPELVLSEVMRDVDLFVGVASVGNDPTWADGGPQGRFRDYWTSYGFGELGASAETRRALLERLVPRLAVADRCTVEGRFLHVRGELHTYKIHLGSGNILMSPNDQYLCIVPKTEAAPDTGYIPYEGDRTLAVILSKALLLADDTSITDPTITSQLRG